jgi:SPP1 gp7 family putative phage head morphogenesis protein
MEAAIERSIDLLRFEAGMRRRVIALLTDMVDDIARQIARGELTSYRAESLRRLLTSIKETVGQAYTATLDAVMDDLVGMAVSEARATRSLVGIDVNVPPEPVMRTLVTKALIQGAPSAEWWGRQSGDTVFRFMSAIRQGVAQGESNSQILKRLRGDRPRGDYGEFGVIRRNAEALVRSSVQTVANKARIQTMLMNDDVIKGMRQVSTLDSRTTDICIAYDGQEWDLDGTPINGSTLPFNGGPPRHWNCRSTLVPITKTYKELGIDAPEWTKGRARSSEGGPVAASTSFASWLKTKPLDYQSKLLGKGKARLWREGKITLQQLLDQSGRPLTLAELEARS